MRRGRDAAQCDKASMPDVCELGIPAGLTGSGKACTAHIMIRCRPRHMYASILAAPQQRVAYR